MEAAAVTVSGGSARRASPAAAAPAAAAVSLLTSVLAVMRYFFRVVYTNRSYAVGELVKPLVLTVLSRRVGDCKLLTFRACLRDLA